jgi:DNA-binding CsgD family transcriptional regulator
MPPLELPVSLLALATGIGSLSVAALLLLKHRTPLLRTFLGFDSALFLMACAFALQSLADSLLRIAPSSIREGAVRALCADLGAVATLARAAGATMIVLVLPFFAQGLFDRQPGAGYRRAGLGSALAMAVLVLIYILGGERPLVAEIASAILFGNIALAILLSALRLRRAKPVNGPAMPKARAFKGFLILSACFLPLFVADAFFLGRPEARALAPLDNTTLPLYFILLNLGSFELARRGFDHPPLMEEDKVSGYGREIYGLTEREAEVLEYVIDGYSLKDLASVLGIAAKTAENHLQSVYRKTGVSNRIQLFQAFQNQRRSR